MAFIQNEAFTTQELHFSTEKIFHFWAQVKFLKKLVIYVSNKEAGCDLFSYSSPDKMLQGRLFSYRDTQR